MPNIHQVRRVLLRTPDVVAAAAPFSLTATANAVDTTTQTTYTFASQNFGTADSTRVIAVIIGARNSGGTQIVTAASTTIGGVTVSKPVEQLASTNAAVSTIVYAAVPTGTSGTVSVTFAGANSRCSIQVYSIISPSSAAPTATGASTANAGTTTFTIPAGGAAIGGSYTQAGGPGTPTATPAGFNNLDLNSNINGIQQTFAFHSDAGVITGSQTLTMTLAGASTVTSTFATWGP
jgi:hypothetical protein